MVVRSDQTVQDDSPCLREQQAVLVRVRAQEMFESRGGRPGLHVVSDRSYGHCGRKATLRSCVRVQVDVLGSMGSLLGRSGGVVNSIGFRRHRLSPLAAFTSGAYFLHNGRR